MSIKSILKETTKNFAVSLDENQLSQLEAYYRLLIEWNEKINLTAITDEEGVAIKHFADSLTLLNYVDIPAGASVIDVGTGAGFPGLVLKIARPDIELTLLDSLNKRLIFLEEASKNIGISAKLIHSRAEDGGRKAELREKYDFSVSRAVAQLNILSEYCIPFVKIGGRFIAMKGPDAKEEIKNAYAAINTIGGKLKDVFEFSLPNDSGNRTIAVIEKIRKTPEKYPRNSGKIKSKPL